jgi:excisionase family DNA binding protein
MQPPVLTVREVAESLRLAEKTVYAMAAAGEIPAFKLRGQWRIRRADFDRWLARQAGALGLGDDGAPPQELAEGVPMPHVGEASAAPTEPLSALTERVSLEEMQRRFVEALGSRVLHHAALNSKPFEADLSPPLPARIRVYMYNATRPPGGRPLGEHKIQLIVPGQRRGIRGSFDNGDGRIVLLVGYSAEEDVFILWDSGLYMDFAWSRNVQVKAETIIEASAGKLATQERTLRPEGSKSVTETLVAAPRRRLAEALVTRMELTRARLLKD